MRHRGVSLLLACLLAACAGTPTPTGPAKKGVTPAPKASKAPGAGGESAAPGTKASASSATGGTPAPGGTPLPVGLPSNPLRVQAVPGGVPLTGVVSVDAAYMVAAGAGNVLSHNGAVMVAAGGLNMVAAGGGNMVAAGGGNVLSHNGGAIVAAGGLNLVAAGGGNLVAAGGGNMVAAGAGNLIAAGGGNMVAAGAGNLVAAGGGNLVAAGGGNLITDGGSTLVAAGGGNLVAAGAGNMVAAGAGNLVAAGAGNYRLMQATATAGPTPPAGPTPAYGETMPAAGMLVWVKSLRTGNPVPVGVDREQHPVYAVFSDDKGAYTLSLDPKDTDPKLVVAEVPFRNDRRLYYGRITADPAKSSLDEDDMLVTRFARLAGATRFNYFLLPFILEGGLDDRATLEAKLAQVAGKAGDPAVMSVIGLVTEPVLQIGQALKKNPNIRQPRAERTEDLRRISEEMADLLLADREVVTALETADVNLQAYLDKTFKYKGNPTIKPGEENLDEDAQYQALKTLNPLYPKAIAGMSAFDLLKAINKACREAMIKLGPEQARALAKTNVAVVAANAFHAKFDPPHVPRPYYTFDKPTDLADFIVTEYLSHPINAPYGCCADAEQQAKAFPETAAKIGKFTGICNPVDTPALCVPDAGFLEFRTSYIQGYLRALLKDAGLPPTHETLLYAAGTSYATSTLVQIASRQQLLLEAACRYGKGAQYTCP